jgi:cytochrome c
MDHLSNIKRKSMEAFILSFMYFIATPALAADKTAELATKKNCMACHAIDKKLVGPSYKDIAKKYQGDQSAKSKLATKVMKGGAGVWGPIPMPANPLVNQQEAEQLVNWILTQK